MMHSNVILIQLVEWVLKQKMSKLNVQYVPVFGFRVTWIIRWYLSIMLKSTACFTVVKMYFRCLNGQVAVDLPAA